MRLDGTGGMCYGQGKFTQIPILTNQKNLISFLTFTKKDK